MAGTGQRLLTGRNSHEIYLVEGESRRWVPDLWTMQSLGVSPSDLQVVEDDELANYKDGGQVRSTVPGPILEEGAFVESENAVYVMRGKRLRPIRNPRGLISQKDFDPEKVIYLPASLIRGLIEEEA